HRARHGNEPGTRSQRTRLFSAAHAKILGYRLEKYAEGEDQDRAGADQEAAGASENDPPAAGENPGHGAVPRPDTWTLLLVSQRWGRGIGLKSHAPGGRIL